MFSFYHVTTHIGKDIHFPIFIEFVSLCVTADLIGKVQLNYTQRLHVNATCIS
jgi:hypothetical protein